MIVSTAGLLFTPYQCRSFPVFINMGSTIVLKAFAADPDQNLTDKAIQDTLQDLINGDITPDIATKRVQALIYEEDENTPQPLDRTEHTVDVGLLGRQYFVLDLLPKVAVQVPAAHPGQDRLVEFLKNILRLPYREVTTRTGEKMNLWSQEIIKEFEEENLAFWEQSSYSRYPTHWEQALT